jgi:hypothetical protein
VLVPGPLLLVLLAVVLLRISDLNLPASSNSKS